MPSLSLWGVRPDLMLLVVVSWNLLHSAGQSMIWALGGGLILDLLSGGPFGAITISLILSNLVTSLSGFSVFHSAVWLPLVASTVATAVYYATYLTLLRFSGYPLTIASSLLQVLLPSIAANGLAMYPVYWTVQWLHKHASQRVNEQQ